MMGISIRLCIAAHPLEIIRKFEGFLHSAVRERVRKVLDKLGRLVDGKLLILKRSSIIRNGCM